MKRSLFKMRTSIDRPIELAGIVEEGEDDLLLTMKKRSNNNIDKPNRGSNNSV